MNAVMTPLLAIVALLCAASTPVLAQRNPEVRFDFEELAGQIPSVVGTPTENEYWAPNGDCLQHTTEGLIVWRKADGLIAFTDGSTTWVDGPYGLQSRDNRTRFSWEAPGVPPSRSQSDPATTEEKYARSVVLALSDLPVGYTLQAGETGVTTNEKQSQTWPDPSEAMALFRENGRVIGYEASYATDDPDTMLRGPFVAVISAVSVYATPEGAHRAFSSEARSPSEWQQSPGPRVGDESILQSRLREGDYFDVVGHRLTFRKGRTYCQVVAAGLAVSTDLDAVLKLARVMESRAESESLSRS